MEESFDPSQVVMRKQRETASRYKLNYGLGVDDDDSNAEGKKKVKWSDSTELREKMKEYRRSQLSICLDYQHIAIEEEREREGVKKWREIKDKPQQPEEEEVEEIVEKEDPPNDVTEKDTTEEKNINDCDDDDEGVVEGNSDSDDDPYCNEVLESRLRVIKAKASRHTVFPAYASAKKAYEDWLESERSADVSEGERSRMTSQLDKYKQIVDLYSSWELNSSLECIDASYQTILIRVMEAKKLGDPPQEVVDSLARVMNDEDNVKRHKDSYSSMVDEMVTDLSNQIQTTSL